MLLVCREQPLSFGGATRCHPTTPAVHTPHPLLSLPPFLLVCTCVQVLDFGSIVVHVFTAEQREHYNLDDFYALAQEVELPFVSDTASATGSLYQPSSSSEQWSKSL